MTALPFEKAEHNHPDFRPGDTVRVHVRVVEGESERIQVFEGVVISRRGGGRSESFTVRKVSFGVGVERTFPINSPASRGSSYPGAGACGAPSSSICAI